MKLRIIITVMLVAIFMTNHAYGQDEDDIDVGFGIVGGSKAMGGEFMFRASIVGITFNLNVGLCGMYKNYGDENMYGYAEPSIGYAYRIYNKHGFSEVFILFGYKSFSDVLNKDLYINPEALNTLTAHIGYTKFLNYHLGIKAKVVVETYSVYGGHFIRTYKNFADGLIGSCGIVYRF